MRSCPCQNHNTLLCWIIHSVLVPGSGLHETEHLATWLLHVHTSSYCIQSQDIGRAMNRPCCCTRRGEDRGERQPSVCSNVSWRYSQAILLIIAWANWLQSRCKNNLILTLHVASTRASIGNWRCLKGSASLFPFCFTPVSYFIIIFFLFCLCYILFCWGLVPWVLSAI